MDPSVEDLTAKDTPNKMIRAMGFCNEEISPDIYIHTVSTPGEGLFSMFAILLQGKDTGDVHNNASNSFHALV